MRTSPDVSVLMTVYNGEATVAQALESLLQQSGPEYSYEIVVVDDGSMDKTPSILSHYSARHSSVRLLHPGRVGRAKALNIGLKSCRAPYVAINDADRPLRTKPT